MTAGEAKLQLRFAMGQLRPSGDSNELAIEAVRKHPNRFAIMGWVGLFWHLPRRRPVVFA
jgi:hypothetical protein